VLVQAAGSGGRLRDGMVQQLMQAGAPLSLETLLRAVEFNSPDALAALLAHGHPAVPVDTSCPSVDLCWSDSWACPIHRLLQQQVCLLG
jgi:hypothetical protein